MFFFSFAGARNYDNNFSFFCVFSVDLVSGFNIATVNHDSRIDWLEVRHWLIPSPIYLLRCGNRTRGTKREKRDQKEREG